jgi:hypothetical protein
MARESMLFEMPCVGDPSTWDHLTETMLPFLSSGCVMAISDTEGRIAYKPVEGVEFPPEFELSIESSDEFTDCYLQAFESERLMLENVEPRNPNEIHIPMPRTNEVPHWFEENKL